jgi:hypothetical protein
MRRLDEPESWHRRQERELVLSQLARRRWRLTQRWLDRQDRRLDHQLERREQLGRSGDVE